MSLVETLIFSRSLVLETTFSHTEGGGSHLCDQDREQEHSMVGYVPRLDHSIGYLHQMPFPLMVFSVYSRPTVVEFKKARRTCTQQVE